MVTQTVKNEILFHFPVTKQWLEQYILVHNQFGMSYRDMQYSLETLFDLKRSIGWVHNILCKSQNTVQQYHQTEDLSNIKISANDELFHHQIPILSGICTYSLYCPFLQKENNRKAETWVSVLNAAIDKGYQPTSVILDGLGSLHSGHKTALPNTTIIYDTFHIIKDLNDLKRYVNNRYKSAKTNLNVILNKLSRAKNQSKIFSLSAQQVVAKRNYDNALNLYQDISTLCSWIQHDILVVAGDDYQTRLQLLTFIANEFEKLEDQMLHRIQPVRKALKNNAEKLLGFLKDLEDEFIAYANELNCDVYWLWKICYAQRYSKEHAKYYQYIAKVKSRFKHHYYNIEQTVIAIMDEIEKSSSVVENLNGRVRKYLRNHVHVNQPSLDLLRFILNHMEFKRSRCEHRQGKSPAEVSHNKAHAHWLELLGYKLFKQAA